MKGGSIVLTPLPQADGGSKNRPALVLAAVQPFGDLVVCGISTQIRLAVPDFDETIATDDPDFAASGLHAPSLVRLGYLTTVPLSSIKGRIGSIGSSRYARLVHRLAAFFTNLPGAVDPPLDG